MGLGHTEGDLLTPYCTRNNESLGKKMLKGQKKVLKILHFFIDSFSEIANNLASTVSNNTLTFLQTNREL